MPIQIRYLNDPTQECVLRPAPLISIDHSIDKTGGGDAFGSNYSITLTGKLLEDRGFPLARDSQGTLFPMHDGSLTGSLRGPYKTFDTSVSHYGNNRPKTQAIPMDYKLDAILYKQKVMRALFAIDGQRMEITPVHGNQPEFICYPRVTSVSFSEGIYINQCDYTITLEADTLLDYDLKVDDDGNPRYLEHSNETAPGTFKNQKTEDILAVSGAFLQSFAESWSLEVDDSLGETTAGGSVNPKSYRLTHTLNATGKAHYYPESAGTVIKIAAWENAKTYVQNRLMRPEIIEAYGPQKIYPNIEGHIGSGTLNLVKQYRGFDHSRTEEVNISDGSYGVTETWLLASGEAYENYSMSISSEMSNPFISVSVDGSIKGLSQISPSGEIYGGREGKNNKRNAYDNALEKYRTVSNKGKFGVGSQVYKRANNSVAVELNSQPTSISLGTNEYDGTITYNLSFDNRPTNVISGVLTENITCNDTYPGDIFAVIPVLGRATGPVLQYIGGRTEYHRDVSIELLMDYTDLPYGHDRKSLLLQKPSLVEPTRGQIRQLIQEFSPANEPGVRKYFIDPPSESWTPKEGRYSFNLSWTYELEQ